MIIRTLPSGEKALISQTDHSRLAGRFAAHWGNAQVATPDPYDSVVRATMVHDFAQIEYETRPLLNEATGEPYQFREVPFSVAQLDSLNRWVDWLLAIDPYAALLVSKHRSGLWKGRYGTLTHPGARYKPDGVRPEIQDFITDAEATQAKLSPDYDADQVQVNYHLLQVWDVLGLYFSCQAPFEEYVEPVPIAYGANGDETVRLELTPHGDWEVAFAPYPFDRRPLDVQIVYKVLPPDPFASLADFRRAYFQAETKVMTYTLV
jgi:hypothetical protein